LASTADTGRVDIKVSVSQQGGPQTLFGFAGQIAKHA
jgi:hypothetical protein